MKNKVKASYIENNTWVRFMRFNPSKRVLIGRAHSLLKKYGDEITIVELMDIMESI